MEPNPPKVKLEICLLFVNLWEVGLRIDHGMEWCVFENRVPVHSSSEMFGLYPQSDNLTGRLGEMLEEFHLPKVKLEISPAFR